MNEQTNSENSVNLTLQEGDSETNQATPEIGANKSYLMMLQLRNSYFALRRKCNAICNQSDCNGDQFVILSILFDQSEGITQQFLASESGYDPATTGTMLKSLQSRNWIDRIPHPTDGRAKLVTITDTGRAVFLKLWNETARLRENFLNKLTDEEQKQLFGYLKTIENSMESLQE